ncbi:Fur-regulated basic protein FbpA [Bacillus cereus]|uniref:Fur-regulated basic protein FbpA n=1 Tax=Bacillus cereus TaxID=1396 RepID=UPI003D175000
MSIIHHLIDYGFYKYGRKQLYELEISELEKHLRNVKKDRVILHGGCKGSECIVYIE